VANDQLLHSEHSVKTKEDAMEMLDRYLEAVRKLLPWKRQDDIIAELRANLEAQLEDKETELGRPTTPQEAEAWLKDLGSPMQMAARYQSQQYLIGPRFFPIYWVVMRRALFWYSIAYAVVGVVQCAMQERPLRALLGTAARLPLALAIVAGCVTVGFAVTEFLVMRFPERFGKARHEWSPASLPPVQRNPVASLRPRTKAKAIGELISGIILLIFWLAVPRHPYLIVGPAVQYLHQVPFRLAPVWRQLYWWVVAQALVNIVWQAAELVLGTWQRSQSVRELVCLTLAIIPQSILFFAPGSAYLLLRHPELWTRYGTMLDRINHGIHTFLAVVLAVTVLQVLFRVGTLLLRKYRKQLAQA
jgi:hypothetical protein